MFIAADRFFGPGGEKHLEFSKSKCLEHEKCKVQYPADFHFHLIRSAEQVGIILCESPHSHEAVEDPGPFVPVDGSKLAITNGKISITSQVRLIDHDVVRAVHRFELVLAALQLHGRKHVFPIIIEVPAGFPKIKAGRMRGVDQVVPVTNMLLAPKVFNQQADRGSLRMPEHETRADVILYADQVQFFPHFSVITTLNLFQPGQIGINLGSGWKRGPIDPLQHRVPLVPAPVGAGNVEQLEGTDMACRWQMGAPTKIHEITLRICGDRLMIGKSLNQLNLVLLTTRCEEIDGLLLGELPPCNGEVAVNDLRCTSFDLFQIFRREGTLEGEVIVKTIVQRRTDRQLS